MTAGPTRMRICFLSSDYTPETTPGQGGGIETYVRAISRGLAERGHDVHVVLPTTGSTRRCNDGGVRIHGIRLPDDDLGGAGHAPDLPESRAAISFAWHARRKVHGLVADGGPFDVIEAPEYKGQGAFLARDPNTRVVIKCHAHLLFCLATNGIALTADTALVADLEREALMRARAIHANSQFLGGRVAVDYGLSPSAITTVPYGIDADRFVPTPSRLRAQLGVGDRPLVLFAGRLEERKGMSVLVRAFADMARRRRDVVLLLAGGDVCGAGHPSNVAWMCAEWERLGVSSDRVLFLGAVAHTSMPPIYSAADLLLAPSPLEAFGFVYLEAMACGCPPIGCTTGGAAEVIADGMTGLLVAPNDVQTLADQALALLDDRPRRARLAAAGRDRVRQQFSLPVMVRRTEQFYASLTGQEAAA